MPEQPATCREALLLTDGTLVHCDRRPGHDSPSEETPQGTPHQTDEHLDVLTGDPWKWWG